MTKKHKFKNQVASKGHFRVPPSLLAGIFVTGFFLVALYIRIYLPWDQIFGKIGVKLVDSDSYYHLRLIENLISNSFHRIAFDPYTHFPQGSSVSWPIFFDWLAAVFIWLIGLGSPSQNVINVVGACFPAVLGALIVIPVYFIGKVLFNRVVGVISAGVVAIMPTGLLLRSRLGDIDHHVAESLFVCMIMLFLILALQASHSEALTFEQIMRRDWKHTRKPLAYSLLAGVFIGIYLLTWVGGLFFIFCLFVMFTILSVINHMRGDSLDHLAIIGSVPMALGAVIALPFLPTTWLSPLYFPSFAIATLTPLALWGISTGLNKKTIPKAYLLVVLLALGIAGTGLFYVIKPALLESMLGQFRFLWRSGAALSISEVQPLLVNQGHFNLDAVWSNFTTGWLLSIAALGLLTYSIIKRVETDRLLFLFWTLLMLFATLIQRRFGYYLAVNVALLCGYFGWYILQSAGFKEDGRRMTTPAVFQKLAGKMGLHIAPNPFSKGIGIVVVFFLIFYPNIAPAVKLAKSSTNIENDAWYSAMVWLEAHSPDPFGDPNFYYDYYDAPPKGVDFPYPSTAYGVIAPWSKGHEITYLAHRLPVANPFQQGAHAIGKYFAAQDEITANQMMDTLRARYVIVDRGMTTSRFYSSIAFTDNDINAFYETYYQLKDGQLSPFVFYYPEYYQSMIVRLFTFDGLESSPQECRVINWEEKTRADGSTYKQLITMYKFSNYEDASSFVTKQQTGHYTIGNTDATKNPLPLAKLDHYKMIYRFSFDQVPELKMYFYQP